MCSLSCCELCDIGAASRAISPWLMAGKRRFAAAGPGLNAIWSLHRPVIRPAARPMFGPMFGPVFRPRFRRRDTCLTRRRDWQCLTAACGEAAMLDLQRLPSLYRAIPACRFWRLARHAFKPGRSVFVPDICYTANHLFHLVICFSFSAISLTNSGRITRKSTCRR